jgi:hypothetical protein
MTMGNDHEHKHPPQALAYVTEREDSLRFFEIDRDQVHWQVVVVHLEDAHESFGSLVSICTP